MDQDAKKLFCLLRFEVNWTSAAEDEKKIRHVFRTQSALYFSSVIVNRNLANGSFKKRKWFPEDLTSKTLISSQYNTTNLKKYGLSHFESICAE